MSKSKKPEPASPQTISDQLREIIRTKIESGEAASATIAKQAGISPAMLHRFMNRERTLRLPAVDKLGAVLSLKLTIG